MELTCDNLDGLNYKHHDFGARGVSSSESAEIGDCAHLAAGSAGSDTIEGIICARKYYGATMAGFSIPAAEHSTITSWGREGEVDAYRNMIKQYGKAGAYLAVVSDSYDIYKACVLWGTDLKDDVINSGATVVIRPDSGDPEEVTLKCIEILGDKFGYIVNSKGYRVLKNVRLIQGDGINERTIKNILANFRIHGWSADNIAFGMGGALLQGINRDTLKFAMKCSAIRVGDEWRDVKKDPITDSVKQSKAGRISTYQHIEGHLVSGRIDDNPKNPKWQDGKIHMPEALSVAYALVTVSGKYTPIIRYQTFDEVRKNASLS